MCRKMPSILNHGEGISGAGRNKIIIVQVVEGSILLLLIHVASSLFAYTVDVQK